MFTNPKLLLIFAYRLFVVQLQIIFSFNTFKTAKYDDIYNKIITLPLDNNS